MRLTGNLFMLVALCLGTACAGASPPEATSFPAIAPTTVSTSISATAVPGTEASAPTQVTSSSPHSPSEYLLSLIPKCEGVQTLDQPVPFDWPNIEQRLKELEKGYTGYYTCAQPPVETTAFLQQGIVKPPYNFTEINRVERPQGTLTLYYHPAFDNWLYLWVVPQPGDAQTSLVIVAESDASLFTPGECRLVVLAG